MELASQPDRDRTVLAFDPVLLRDMRFQTLEAIGRHSVHQQPQHLGFKAMAHLKVALPALQPNAIRPDAGVLAVISDRGYDGEGGRDVMFMTPLDDRNPVVRVARTGKQPKRPR